MADSPEKVPNYLSFSVFAITLGWIALNRFERFHHPPVGTYIAIFAFAAAILTIWPPQNRWAEAAWVLVFGIFLALELSTLYQQRIDDSNSEQIKTKAEDDRFAGLLKVEYDNFGKVLDQNQRQFDTTMATFQTQSATLSRLHGQQAQLEQQVRNVPLAGLTSKELSDKTREITSRMREVLRMYGIYDSEISNSYFEGERAGMSPEELQDWRDDEKRKQAKLRQEYETLARKLTNTANRFRIQMLSELPHQMPEDVQRAAWFKHPSSGDSPFLSKINENATYLDNLADRSLKIDPVR